MTRAFREFLSDWREGIKEQWAKGHFREMTKDETELSTSEALAQVKLLEQILEVDYERFSEKGD